eukprot:TRINITY_DN24764_c0_g1_i1.p1 TRINITY_DN24764_c0_g1~~TRINITY_DN24764_c0_g1_i1.p1  ORF type:complete len:329 (-),score=49.50 TRINITY_DN24764_c0_g1_i1:308-1294(-)
MVKGKHRPLAAIATKKDSLSSSALISSLNSTVEGEPDSEDSWVVVKKQRITILVPPAAALQSPTQSPRMNRLQKKTRKKVKSRSKGKSRSHVLDKSCKKHSVGEQKKFIPFGEEIQSDEGEMRASEGIHVLASQSHKAKENLPMSTFKTVSEGSDWFIGKSTLQPPSDHFYNAMDICRTRRSAKTRACASRPPIGGVSSNILNRNPVSSDVTVKRGPKFPPCLIGEKDVFLLRSVGCLDAGGLLNQRMRASNLERKLEKAGGLRRWLELQGLEQFIWMFQRENIDKYQLLDLTMGKLKDMGAVAVGPRRKLIHAIDRLCQPYYFKSSF